MEISRIGYSRRQENPRIALSNPAISFKADGTAVEVTKGPGRDIAGGNGRYTYTVKFPLSDLRGVLERLAAASTPEQVQAVREELGPALPALVRLSVICVGELP